MGSVAAARRTQSSYPRFLASTNPSDLTISTSSSGQSNNATGAYTGALANKIARLPGVKHVESSVYLNIAPLAPDGAPRISQVTNLATVASVDGLLFNQDRAAVVDGRMADPGRADEVMMNADAARILGVHVGQTIAMGAYSGAQTALPGFGTPKVRPALRIDARLVGIIVLSNQVVQDTVDRYPDFVIFTPALARRLLGDVNTDVYGVQLEHGSRDVGAFEREFARTLPPHSFYQFHVTSNVTAKVQSAVRPEAIAAGIFGAIATLATLLIGLQLISRQLGSHRRGSPGPARPGRRPGLGRARRPDRRPRRSRGRLAAGDGGGRRALTSCATRPGAAGLSRPGHSRRLDRAGPGTAGPDRRARRYRPGSRLPRGTPPREHESSNVPAAPLAAGRRGLVRPFHGRIRGSPLRPRARPRPHRRAGSLGAPGSQCWRSPRWSRH